MKHKKQKKGNTITSKTPACVGAVFINAIEAKHRTTKGNKEDRP